MLKAFRKKLVCLKNVMCQDNYHHHDGYTGGHKEYNEYTGQGAHQEYNGYTGQAGLEGYTGQGEYRTGDQEAGEAGGIDNKFEANRQDRIAGHQSHNSQVRIMAF